jgi:hypothetical protein
MSSLISNPALRATHTYTKETLFFHNEDQAKQWITENKEWTLQRLQVIDWSYPLDQTIKQTCWVKL